MKAQELSRLSPKQQARWNALPQEEKDKIDTRVDADIQQEKETADKLKADALMKAYNADPELWRKKNLLRVTARNLIPHTASGCDEEVSAMFAGYYDGKVRALSKPTDTELELGLVELLAMALLRCQWIETQYPAAGSIALCDYWNRNLEGAERRVRKLSVDLARVRRLALPILLLNYAERQQINMGFVSKAPKGKG